MGIVFLIYRPFQAKLENFFSTKHRTGFVGAPGGFCQIGSEMAQQENPRQEKRPQERHSKEKGRRAANGGELPASRYSRGEISAGQAADRKGPTYNVGDVYVISRKAGLPLPDADGAFERAEFERAKRLFGGRAEKMRMAEG